MEKRSVKAVPDFKKLHQKWDERMKCTRQSKPTTVTKSFHLGRQTLKQENDVQECLSTPVKQETTKNARIRPPNSRTNPRSSKRQVLDGLQKENRSPGKKVKPALLQKQQGIEFEEDQQALSRILSTANENVPSAQSQRQTFAFGSKTPQASQEPVRMSIYDSCKPRPLAQIEKATVMALSSNVRRATTLGVKAGRTINKTPAPPAPPSSVQRQSIYMRCDTIKKNTPNKQLGTPSKILRPKTPATMTAKRVPVVSKPGATTSINTGAHLKWADVLTPSKAVQDPLKRALFAEEPLTPDPIKEEPKTSNQSTPNTSQGALSPRLSLSEADLKKFQEIEEREKQLLKEIQAMSCKNKAKGQMEKVMESPEQVTSRENIDLCAASVQKAADSYDLYHKTKRQDQSSGSEFSLGPSPDQDSVGDLKKGVHQVGHSPLSDVDSAVDMGSMHNCTIDELNQSLSLSQTHFDRLQSEFRTLQSGYHGDGVDIMKKLQQIEKQQHLVLRQQQDLRKQLADQQKQLVEQQRLMTEQKHASPPLSGAQNDAEVTRSTTAGANRRFSTSENSPFALFNRCQALQKDSRMEDEIRIPTSVKLSPAVILKDNSNIPIRTPLAMVENTRQHIHQTPVKLFPPCVTGEQGATPIQSIQSAFRCTRLTNSETPTSNDSFELGTGLLNMTPYTAATSRVRTKLLTRTILSATSTKYHNALLDEEVALFMTCGRKTEIEDRFDMCCRLTNPIAKTLMEGDDMHFIPITEETTHQGYTPEGSAFSTFVR